MKYAKLTDADVQKVDFMNQGDAKAALDLLQNMPFNVVSPKVTAGATDTTVTENIFAAPTKCQIARARFIIDVVQVGDGNTPTISLINTDDTNAVVATKADLALAKSAGDVIELTVDADKATLDAGDVLALSLINPAGTITTALAGKLQIEWVSVV
ncbi:MAG TPA: hypothetical protein VHO03_16840 [Ignavibacteriales bacterium]|nr:hypothetical protein [Ignavibacteriales bacterium]